VAKVSEMCVIMLMGESACVGKGANGCV